MSTSPAPVMPNSPSNQRHPVPQTEISPLSADSVADRGNSVPDFTRGVWQSAEPLGVVGASSSA
jgi:hypothetical protein